MTEVGYASLGIIPSFRNFGRDLESGTSKHMAAAGSVGGARFGDAAGKTAGSRFASGVKKFGKVAAVGLAGVAAGAFTIAKDAVDIASSIEESTNKLGQVFGKSAAEITKFSSGAADAIGQSDLQARNAAATFGIFGKAAKLTNRQNAKFAKQMTTLASDLASFHDASPEETIEALGSALRGEAEPMRKYGVLLDEAALKAEALALGILKPLKDEGKIKQLRVDMIKQQQEYNEAIGEFGPKSLEAREAQADLEYLHGRLEKAMEGTVGTLTQEQKILAARSAIMKQTADAQGDFARTSGGLANQQRELTAKWEDAKIALGQALLPAVNEIVTFLNDKGVPAFERFSDWFVGDGIPAIKDFGGFLKDDVLPPLKRAGEFAADLVGWLKDLPGPAKLAGLAAVMGGGAAAKLRGGKGGALGTAGKVLGMTKPVPVFVTNKGFGAGGGVGGAAGKGGFVATAGKFGMVGLLAGAAYAMYKMPDIWNFGAKKLGEGLGLEPKKGGTDPKPAAAGSPEHKKLLEGWQGAEGGVNKYNESLERTRDSLLTVTNGVTGFASKAEVVKDKYLASLRSVQTEARSATETVIKLGEDLDWAARPRQARIDLAVNYSDNGWQPRGGPQEFTNGPTNGGGGPTFTGPINVKADTYEDFVRKVRRRARSQAGGGVGF